MKTIIRNALLLIIMLSITSCTSNYLISSPYKTDELVDNEIVSIETKDGRTFKNERPLAIFCSRNGIYLVDSTGTKNLKHEEIKSVTVNKANYLKTASLVASLGLTIYIIHFFSGGRITN